MRATTVPVALAILLTSAPALARKPAPAKAPDLDTASLEAFLRELFAEHFDRMDFAIPLAPGPVLFVADENGAPIVADTPASIEALRARFASWQADGWKMTTTFTSLRCEAAAALGACSATYTQHLWQGEQDQGTISVRGTLVARPIDGHWALLHLHESPGVPVATAP